VSEERYPPDKGARQVTKRELPISLSDITWILLDHDWIEIRKGTATYHRDDAGDLNGWISFEDVDDFTGGRIWCQVATVTAFGSAP
jgi:hypothetical protein